ncbi:MAG: DUF935 family protein [Bacteroidales bacterium]|nr:DUF935 family protein [Bacteroidales bacterium]
MKAKTDKIVINQVIVSQIRRDSLDISNWRSAIQSAESIYYPNRTNLYDIYNEALLDTHLSAVLQKRKTAVLNTPIEFYRNGEADKTIETHTSSPWFLSLISDMIDTIFWGYSVFQFFKAGEWIEYDLIPRKHIKPEKGLLVKNQNDPTGIPYKDAGYKNLLEVGETHNLGLLCKAAPWVIYKRNGVADYAQFAEIFGQPIREGTYDAFDDLAREKLKNDMESMGGSSIFIHPDNTQIKLIETQQKTGGSDLYNDLISLCNAEISKLILGNTLTTDQGEKGARSLGEIHKEVEDQILVQDKRFVLNVLNYDFSDILRNLGINTAGGEFVFAGKEELHAKEKIDIDATLAGLIPISDDYFYETYGIPRPDNYEALKKEFVERRKEPDNIRQVNSANTPGRLSSFFLNALGRRAPLDF